MVTHRHEHIKAKPSQATPNEENSSAKEPKNGASVDDMNLTR